MGTVMLRASMTGLALLLLTSCGGSESGNSAPITGSTPAPSPTPSPTPTGNVLASHSYAKTAGPDINPLKGWNSGWWSDHPEASVGFQYVKWEEFEPQDDQFDFAAVETVIDRPGTRGRHIILRLYCEWHGDSTDSECPDWIYSSKGVARLQGSNGRYITDFNNPVYIAEAEEAIRAFAARFDNDPRVHSIQLGILGYWGEWHSSGSSFNGSSYQISDAARQSILAAYQSAYSNKTIMGRYPWREPLASAGDIGFHNDYFIPNNGHSEEFDRAVDQGAKWRNGPIGGEVPPRSTTEAAAERSALYGSTLGETIIRTGRYSTMAPGAYRQQSGDSHYSSYMALHRLMGYNFQIDTATFADQATLGRAYDVTINIDNIGVAPIYYDWDVELALLDSTGRVVANSLASVDLRRMMPATRTEIVAGLSPASSLSAGTYRLAIRIVQPGATAAKSTRWKLNARNTYILFANTLPTVEGTWGADHALTGGWSILGDVSLQA